MTQYESTEISFNEKELMKLSDLLSNQIIKEENEDTYMLYANILSRVEDALELYEDVPQ